MTQIEEQTTAKAKTKQVLPLRGRMTVSRVRRLPGI
jgi:hypothetical protein